MSESGGPGTGPDYGSAYDAGAADRPAPENIGLGQIVSEITSDLSTLMRQELDLAKAEVRQEATKSGKAVGMLGGAGFAGYMLALFASLALVGLLSALLDSFGWAALIVALLWGVVGAVLYRLGRTLLRQVNPKPRQTIETLQEDVQWAKNRTR